MLERGRAFDELIEEIFGKIRFIFESNSLLVNIIDVRLHICCNNPKWWSGLGCIAKQWNNRIKRCFLNWSNNLKRTKQENQFLSYMIGEGETISDISQQVSTALELYKRNFAKLARHKHKVDMNLNTLSAINTNLTSYERHHYESQIISSILTSGNIKRITENMQMGSDLADLRQILHGAEIDSLLKQISDGLLKINPVCQLQKGRCKIHSYLTQGTSNNTINLHRQIFQHCNNLPSVLGG